MKDTFTEEDAYAEQRKNVMLQDSVEKSKMELEKKLAQDQILLLDSLKKVGGVINYSVAVVNASESSWWSNLDFYGKGEASETAVNGAVVTLAQHGRRFTSTTDASGIATFADLRVGTANVNITMNGFTSVDYVVDLPPVTEDFRTFQYTDSYEGGGISIADSATQKIIDLVRNVGTMIPVFSTTANLSTITGKATVETDLTNDAPEAAANVKVYGIINVYHPGFFAQYMYNPSISKSGPSEFYFDKFDHYGKVKQIAFGSTVSTATTDAQGNFSLAVPSTPQGLPIYIEVDQFALNQTILVPSMYGNPVFGPQTIRTLFGGSDFDPEYSNIATLGMESTNVQSAYVQFAAPTGTAAAQPTSNARATAVLGRSGIKSVVITNPGSNYTQAPIVEFSLGIGYNAVKAEGTAILADGKIQRVDITNPGSGYFAFGSPSVTFTESIVEEAKATPEFSFSVIDVDMTSTGSGYTQTPPAVTITGSGSGATAHVVMNADIKEINMTAMGSGYTEAPQVVISDNFGAREEAEAIMTVNNPLLSIKYNGNSTWLYPASPLPTATIVGDGTGATANVDLGTVGKVMNINVGNSGSGYTSAPIVTITGGGGFGAAAYATLGADTVRFITITDMGQGYTATPTITLTGGAGTGASATAVLGFPIQNITLNQAGIGYSTVSTIDVTNTTITHNYISYCDVKYNKGVRSVSFDDSGWYFSGNPTVTFNSKDGLGSGAAATAVAEWWIDDILVDNQGSGYKEDDFNDIQVVIAPPANGTQATATAVLGKGILSGIKLVNGGEGYTAAPNVYVVDDAEAPGLIKQAEVTASASNGHVTGFTITDPGEGYDYGSAMAGYYTIDISTYNPRFFAAATAEVYPESGKISYIRIDDAGAGYKVAPSVVIFNDNQGDANGFGTGAAATAVVTDGRVTSIDLTNAGSGYYVAPKVDLVVNSAVLKATGICNVSADGRITGVEIINPGYGYITSPALTFTASVTGKGANAEGIAQISNGSVSNVIMTNQGSGYLGKNNPSSTQGFSITNDDIYAVAGKSYVIDIYFGTGKRTVPEGTSF
ncbi:MAG TPA: hypothetical protein VHO68_11740 [Bacteroidales bacterium]|nr:hypothetical protein [Bacteroidales bacterium]